MTTHFGSHKKFAPVAILAILPLFAACGGEGEEEEEPHGYGASDFPQTCYSWIEYYDDPATCLSGGTSSGSSTQPAAGSSSGSTSTSGSESTSSSGSASGVAALINDEFEPNDSMANANIMDYPSRSGTVSHIGWSANGSINDAGDTVDYFAFTAPLTRNYMLRLCPPLGTSCHGTTGLDSLTAFYELLDSNGNVLYSSQASDTNVYQATISSGVVYYVRVMAGDTMGAQVDYAFEAFEWQ